MGDEESFEIQYYQFFVSERPFCVWDYEIRKRNLDFLESIDPSYFIYMVEKHIPDLGEGEQARNKESQHAALALRTIYSQAIETFFAFLCSSLQAPFCPPAWINLYSNSELNRIVSHIQNNEPIHSQTKLKILTWKKISELIFQYLILEDREKETEIKAGFAGLWSRFSSDLLNPKFSNEYNSIKHGLRVHLGGFYLSIGAEEKPGVPAPPEKMRLLGKSNFGTKFFVLEKIGENKQNIQIKSMRRNWNPDDFAYGIQLLSMSISNIISFLKVINGVSPEKVQFEYPDDMDKFHEPWKRIGELGIRSMSGFDPVIYPSIVDTFSKDIILENYKSGVNFGTKRFSLTDLK